MRNSKFQIGILFAGIFLAIVGQAEEPPSGDLRKREHVLSWDYTSSTVKIKPEGSDTSKTSSGEMNIEYGRNLGWWAIGGGLSSDVSKDDDNDETSLSTIFLGARVNFIENLPGNNWIPYAYLELGTISGEIESGSDTIDISGSGREFGIGLEWYPFGELFAVNVELGFLKADVYYENAGTTVKADFDATELSVGYSLVF